MTSTKQRLAEALEDNRRLSEQYYQIVTQLSDLIKKYDKLKTMIERAK